MNSLTLALASMRSRPLHTALCTAAVAAGIALLCAIFLLSQALTTGFARNAQGIDLIVGAKGSPLQLVLSSVYHADIPAGNMPMAAYDDLRHNPHIRKAIPLALGDNFHGFRMVGTTPDYVQLYGGTLAQGAMFAQPFETVAGADTDLKIGDKIAVTHGFSADGDDIHNDHLYTITGLLEPSGTVLDKLLITQVASVQQLHAAHHHHHHHEAEMAAHGEEPHHAHDSVEKKEEEMSSHHHHHDDDGESDEGDEAVDMAHQITAVLLQVRTPLDLMNLPRALNQSAHIMAAAPSYEIARLIENFGLGREIILLLSSGFVLLSALILWATLSSGLALRRYDLAVLRVLGATPQRLANTVIAEALLISSSGAVIGVLAGHVFAYMLVLSMDNLHRLTLPGSLLIPHIMDGAFIILGLGVGLLASLVPSLTAARTDIAALLAKGRV